MKNIKLLLAGLVIGFVVSEAVVQYKKMKNEKEIEDKEISELLKLKRKYPKV
jgi:hypothetical protein